MRRGSRAGLAAAAIAAFAVVATVPVSQGADGRRQSSELTYTAKGTFRATGILFDVDYRNPGDPAGKPPAVRRVVFETAPGSRYDTGVPAQCTASDAELMANGAAACPAASKIGRGVVQLDTGVPGPGRFLHVDIDFLNNADELIFVSTARAGGARVIIRGRVSERRIVTDVAMLPGAPPDGSAIDTVRVFFPALERGDRAYHRTPSSCPRSRQWVNRVSFTYEDGVTESIDSPTPCKRRALPGRRTKDRWRGRPRSGHGGSGR